MRCVTRSRLGARSATQAARLGRRCRPGCSRTRPAGRLLGCLLRRLAGGPRRAGCFLGGLRRGLASHPGRPSPSPSPSRRLPVAFSVRAEPVAFFAFLVAFVVALRAVRAEPVVFLVAFRRRLPRRTLGGAVDRVGPSGASLMRWVTSSTSRPAVLCAVDHPGGDRRDHVARRLVRQAGGADRARPTWPPPARYPDRTRRRSLRARVAPRGTGRSPPRPRGGARSR